MKARLLIFFVLCASVMSAQDGQLPYRHYDFSGVDVTKIEDKDIHRQIDSIYHTSGYDSLVQLLSLVSRSRYTAKYIAFTIGYQAMRADLHELKGAMDALGFGTLSETFGGVPWGFDIRGERFLLSYVFAPGIKNRASNDDYSIEVSGMNAQLAIGYDLLKWKRLDFYPQLALGFQDFDVEITRKDAVIDIVQAGDLFLRPAGTSLKRKSWTMSYGIELNYHVKHSDAAGGIILGARFGRTVPFAQGKFKVNGERSSFALSDEINKSFFSVLIKFYGISS